MILDKLTEFCDDVSVVAGASAVPNVLGNQVPLSQVRDIGNSGPIYLQVRVKEEIITGGVAGGFNITLSSGDDEALTNAVDHFVSGVFATDGTDATTLKAGTVIAQVMIPLQGATPYKAFLGIRSVVTATAITAGSIDAFLTLDPSSNISYPDAVN